jgi:hypothetical protein
MTTKEDRIKAAIQIQENLETVNEGKPSREWSPEERRTISKDNIYSVLRLFGNSHLCIY